MLNRQDDPPTGVPFLLGAVAFAAVGAAWLISSLSWVAERGGELGE